MSFSIKNVFNKARHCLKSLSNMNGNTPKKLQSAHTEEEMRDIAARICKNYLHGLWKVVDPSQMQFRKVCGGLSNYIYVMSLPEDVAPLYPKLATDPADEDSSLMSQPEQDETGPRKVLLRIYGQIHGDRAMDAIVTESVIFTLLSERRLGPKLYGVFSGGRIEEYIPGRSLKTKELTEPAISMKIAEKIATIHTLDIPLTKEPSFIWKTMGKWLKTVKEECFTSDVVGKNEEEQKAINRLSDINYDAEIEWLRKYLATVDSPVVFCHNDLQEGNIMLLEEPAPAQTDEYDDSFEDDQRPEGAGARSSTRAASIPRDDSDAETTDTIISHMSDSGEPKIFFIDFEYCAYNYRGFDLANHFQEWIYDYTNPEHPYFYDCPEQGATLEQKEIFIKEYLKNYQAIDDKEHQVTIDDINKLLGEIEAFALASHLFWTLWSIVNGRKSQIAFGYWEYGARRLETYLRLKQEVIKKEKFGLPQKRKIEEVDI